MITDIMTVMWKEWKGLLRYSGSRWKGVAILVTPVALFGILFPIQFREGWLSSGWSVAISFITPLLLITSTISESFAGERERHTLETLLASRLPDRAVLLGKLLTSVLFGWGMTLILLFISLVVVNIFLWHETFMIYEPAIFWLNIGLSLLTSGLVSTLGILISLRSRTVQSAAQTIMLLLFMPFLILQAVVFLLPNFLSVEILRSYFERLDLGVIVSGFLALLFLFNLGLLYLVMIKFKRAKLIF
jgi:ABC-2 type transport system permease protein